MHQSGGLYHGGPKATDPYLGHPQGHLGRGCGCYAIGFSHVAQARGPADLRRQSFLQDTPACVAVELLSWDADPIFPSCLAALKAACRFCVRSPAWLESLPITIGAQAWPFWLAGSVQVLHRLGWSASPDGRTVNRTDDRGICRIFQFEVDSPLILGLLKLRGPKCCRPLAALCRLVIGARKRTWRKAMCSPGLSRACTARLLHIVSCSLNQVQA